MTVITYDVTTIIITFIILILNLGLPLYHPHHHQHHHHYHPQQLGTSIALSIHQGNNVERANAFLCLTGNRDKWSPTINGNQNRFSHPTL